MQCKLSFLLSLLPEAFNLGQQPEFSFETPLILAAQELTAKVQVGHPEKKAQNNGKMGFITNRATMAVRNPPIKRGLQRDIDGRTKFTSTEKVLE